MAKIKLNRIYNMDCLEGMKAIPDGAVDMILTDLPYGTTCCEWDAVIPFSPLWKQYERVIKENGAILLFSSQPFTTDLINSNRKMFRYEIIWEKTQVSGFLNAKKMPLRTHENILVFYKNLPVYNPQMWIAQICNIGQVRKNSGGAQQYNEFRKDEWEYVETGERYPTDVIKFSNWNGAEWGKTAQTTIHPTQKPVALCEYLIKTYTNEGEVVLDNCMGSGTTALACFNTNRNYIGFELDPDYYEASLQRIRDNQRQIRLDDIYEASLQRIRDNQRQIRLDDILISEVTYGKD